MNSAGRSANSSPTVVSGPTDAWLRIGSFVFAVVRLNLVVVVACLPLTVVLVAAVEPLRAFPTMVGAALMSSPGLSAAFAAFRDMPGFAVGPGSLRDELSDSPAIQARFWDPGDYSVLRPFMAAYRRVAARSLKVSAVCLAVVLVLGVDAAWASTQSFGLVLMPMLVVATVVGLVTWILSLVLVTEIVGGSTPDLVRAAASCAVRRWYLSILSVAVCALAAAGVVFSPILVLALGTSLILYLVWANSRWSTLPVLRATAALRVAQPAG